MAQEQPSGSAVYSQAIAAMRAVSMPRYIVYRVTTVHAGMSLTFRVKPSTHQFIAAFPAFDGSTLTTSAYVRYDTATAAGMLYQGSKDILAMVPFPVAPEVRALVHEGIDAVATPMPTITASPVPSASASPGPDAQGIAMIVAVSAFSSTHYNVDNVGLEQIGGQPAYHLKMTANDGDTGTYPLTDIYVDQTTHLVRRVVLGGGQRGFFQGGGGSGTFDFSAVGKYWLVTHLSIEIGGHMLLFSKHASLDYTLDDFQFPDSIQAPF
jgi:hypothetical protein